MLNRYCENEIGGGCDNRGFNIIESILLPKTLIISDKEITNESEFKEVLEDNIQQHKLLMSNLLVQYN